MRVNHIHLNKKSDSFLRELGDKEIQLANPCAGLVQNVFE